MIDEDLAKDICGQYACLKDKRQTHWDPAWRSISQLLFSREPTILWSTTNKRWKPNNKMFDRTGAEAIKVASNGLVSQWMSPARTWMQLSVEDPKLADRQAVRVWLEQTTKDMLGVFAASNIYGSMKRFVRDMLWATPVVYMEEDDKDVVRLYNEEIGTFVIDKDERGVINTVIREFAMSARNIRAKFPDAELPNDVMQALRQNDYGKTEFPVIHYVGPNLEYDEESLGYKSKKFISVYTVCEKVLKTGGYSIFPYLVGQWDPEGEDVYSVTPGLDAYGDMRSLQIYAKGKLKAAEKAVDPALAIPSNVSDVRRDPGSEVTVSGAEPVRNLEDIRYDWKGIQVVTGELKDSVRRAFSVDLFQHFLNSDRREQTAEEVRAKLDEQYAALSPVVAGMNQNVAARLIDFVFDIMVKRKMVRPAPPELQGIKLKIRYLSEFERAQQTGNLRQIQGFAADLVNFAPIIQNPPDQVDVDELIQQLATHRQIPETIVRDDDGIDARRNARAKIQAQQMQLQQAEQQSKIVSNLKNMDPKSWQP